MANSRLCSIPDCGKTVVARDLCGLHYQRLMRRGDPQAEYLAKQTPKGDAYRYFCDVVMAYEGDDCLIWPYNRRKDGYAYLSFRNRMRTVHRLVCELVRGMPTSKSRNQAAHSCGNGHLGCVTANHLSWKTPLENSADIKRHGPRDKRVCVKAA